MVAKIIELDKVKDLDTFIGKLVTAGLQVEPGPHVVLEDHSELSLISVYRESRLVAHLVVHYITQYYRAVMSNVQSDSEYLEKLLEIKYSGERWNIPVNPVYVVVYDDEILGLLSGYEDNYPVGDAESILNFYRERNPNYRSIPRVVVARLTGDAVE